MSRELLLKGLKRFGQGFEAHQHASGKRWFVSPFAQVALTVDVAILAPQHQHTEILLIRRGNEPFVGKWALPGGFVDVCDGESPHDAAQRELREETSLERVQLRQVTAAAGAERDPRGYTCTIVFAASVDKAEARTRAGDDAAEVGWFALDALPELAFDHLKLVEEVKHAMIGCR